MAGRPVVLGPGGGSSEPPKSSSTARPSPPPAAPQPSPAPAPARPSPAAGSSAAAAGADKSAGNASKPSAPPTSSAASATPAPNKDGGTPNSGSAEAATSMSLPVGSYARISGLKAAPELNGKLCQVVRPGDTPDRNVVRTNVGEKALKHANLEGGGAVYPKHMVKVFFILFMLVLLVAGDVCRTRGRNALSAAAMPVIGAICLFVTLGVCGSVWWQCRPKSVWFPPVSEFGANAPIRNVYRGGFLVFALLLASTIGLYQELLLNRMEIPAPMELPLDAPAPGPALESDSEIAAATAVAEDAAVADRTGDDDPKTAKTDDIEACSWDEQLPQCYGLVNTAASTKDECQSACCANVLCSVWQYNVSWEPKACWLGTSSDCTGPPLSFGARKQDNSTANAAKEPRRNSTNEMLITGPDRSLAWGYAAAAGAGLQAVFIFDGKLNVQSVLHSLAMFLFALGAFQHSVQSNFWCTLPWGKSLVEVPSWLGTVLKLRRSIAEYGPLVLMMGPLTSQFWSTSQRATTRSRQSTSMKSIFQDSGMPKSIAAMLWALMLVVGVFYGLFAFDFWYAMEHSGGSLEQK